MKKAVIILGFAIACSNPGNKERAVASDRQLIAALNDSTDSGSTTITQTQKEQGRNLQQGKNQREFASFWTDFRGAILRKDTSSIQAMTHFPFQTRGESDMDPLLEYSKEEFPLVLQAYLQQREHISLLEDHSQFDLIKATKDAVKKQQTQNWVRIGDLEFKWSGKEWKLVFAYLSRETREKLEKKKDAR